MGFQRFSLCLVLLMQGASGHSTNCDTDQIFDEEKTDRSFVYKLPNAESDKEYWYYQQYSFFMYGKIDENSTSSSNSVITAKLLTEDGNIVYSTVIDCDNKSWKSEFTDSKSGELTSTVNHNANDGITDELSGSLTNACDENEGMFDLILKVNNAYQMSWIFNGQALQTKTRVVKKVKRSAVDNTIVRDASGRQMDVINNGVQIVDVEMPLKMNTKYIAFKGTKLSVEMTGQAVYTRFAFGQCETWPVSYEGQCQKVRTFVQARSKNNIEAIKESIKESLAEQSGDTDEDSINAAYDTYVAENPDSILGLGLFGNNMPVYVPECYLDSNYFNYKQLLHPDRFLDENGVKVAGVYGCCTDMNTGMIWDADSNKPASNRARANVNENCRGTDDGGISTMPCAISRDDDLIQKAIIASTLDETS